MVRTCLIVGVFLFGLLLKNVTAGGMGAFVAECGGKDRPKVKISKLPELVIFEKNGCKEGLSAAFGGTLPDAVVVAGGCNFPDIPAASGGKKVYYDRIYVLRNPERKNAGWELAGCLPVAVANGASVTLSEGIVCIGGCNHEKALNAVWLLNWNAGHSGVVVKSLAALPVAMDNLTAATDGKRIYIAGGNVDGMPEKRCFMLDGIEAKEWLELPVYPGPIRLQPSSGVVDRKFYLLGGFQPVVGDQECIVATDGLAYDPEAGKWSVIGDIMPEGGKEARSLVGAASLVLDGRMLVFQGGVDRAVFKSAVDNPLLQRTAAEAGQLVRLKHERHMYMRHEPGWYKFSRRLLVFCPEEGIWSACGDWEEIARAGAVMVLYKKNLVVVNGEIKPGVRSAGACMIDLDIH